MAEVALRGGDPRRAVTAAVVTPALGVVLVLVGVATGGAFSGPALLGVALLLVGLVLLARLPSAFERSVLDVGEDGLAWRGTGAGDWSAPWAEVRQVRLERSRRGAAVVVVLTDDRAVLSCRPGALPVLGFVLARHAPGVPVVEGPGA